VKKIKVQDLSGTALDWVVAKCEQGGQLPPDFNPRYSLPYSTDWSDGGPLIERENIGLREPRDACKPDGVVVLKINYWYARTMKENGDTCVQNGPTALVAAMRCYVASKMGSEIEIPDEL